jgi:hypothetical protein
MKALPGNLHRCLPTVEVVADDVSACPFCNTPIPHAQVKVGPKTWLIDREGFSLIGRDLDFRDDDDGRYVVLRFSRDIQTYRSTLRAELVIKGEAQELNSGIHQLELRSRDGRSRTVAQVTVQ